MNGINDMQKTKQVYINKINSDIIKTNKNE